MSASEGLRFIAVLCCALVASSAWAQQAPSREQEQIRRLRQQVQQLQQEQAASVAATQQAAARSNELKTKLDAVEAALQSARAAGGERAKAFGLAQQELQALRTEQSALSANRDEVRSQLQASTRELQALRAEHAQQRSTLTQRDAAVAELGTRLRAQATGLQTCIANNQALHTLGQELLARYANKGVWEAAKQNEPFLQLSRVTLENLVSGYQDKLDQQALAPGPAAQRGAAPDPRPAPAASQRVD